jgi:hypothetical protein
MTNKNSVLVRLFRNNHPVANCKTIYVGLLGMQINAGPLAYPKGTQLEVEFTDGSRQHKLPVVVTNHLQGDMGLTYLNHDLQTKTTLMNIILSIS